MNSFSRIRCVGDSGILVEFGDRIAFDVNDRVVALDRALQEAPPPGLVSLTPAYASLLVGYDPLTTTPETLIAAIEATDHNASPVPAGAQGVEIPVCYDPPYGPDLARVAADTGRSVEAVVAAHLSASYRVYMYGFAPGYAYLGGVAPEIQVPRRTTPVRDVPTGSVIIAGPQCIVTTVMMPTGWWIIGRSPARIFRPEDPEPFLLQVGAEVRFLRISAAELAARCDDG